jgi:hypothetical protein
VCLRPRINVVQVNFLNDDVLREFLERLSRWKYFFEHLDSRGVNVVGKFDLEFDKQVAWFMMPLRWHALTMYDLELVLRDDMSYRQGRRRRRRKAYRV